MNKRLEISDEEFLDVLKDHTYKETAEILKCSFSYCSNRAKALGINRTAGRKPGRTIEFKKD